MRVQTKLSGCINFTTRQKLGKNSASVKQKLQASPVLVGSDIKN